MKFGEWHPLDDAGLAACPRGPAALQVRRAAGLEPYPTGKSAMVFYAFAATDAQRALRDAFDDEIEAAGARGKGPLWFRFCDEDEAAAGLGALYDSFVARFGAPPVLNDDEDDG